MNVSAFSWPVYALSWLSSGIARGITETIRYFYRLSGVDVSLRAICLNSVCALPVSPLAIDSEGFQRIVNLGAGVLVGSLLALTILVAVQALIRVTLTANARTATFLRRFVTVKTVVLAACGAVLLSAAVAVLVNNQYLGDIKAPYSGVEWATIE